MTYAKASATYAALNRVWLDFGMCLKADPDVLGRVYGRPGGLPTSGWPCLAAGTFLSGAAADFFFLFCFVFSMGRRSSPSQIFALPIFTYTHTCLKKIVL